MESNIKSTIFTPNPLQMALSASKLNLFLLTKLPSAFLCGVRVLRIDPENCVTKVRHKWINQNPFNSLYFAVQAMAAELSTGALVIHHIADSKMPVSMLVARNKSEFVKKATGKIEFSCSDGAAIKAAIDEAIQTKSGVTCWARSIGTNEKGEVVATFDFEWTLKLREQKSARI